MIARVRLVVLLARPAVMVLLGLFAATGLAQAGASSTPGLLGRALVPVAAFLVFAVLVNDLADEAIDRVNLPGDTSRALVSGLAHRTAMRVAAVSAGLMALTSSLLLPWPAPAIVAVGLILAAAYSVPPLQLSKRGVVASLLLPVGYVAVPYLLGVLAGRPVILVTDVGVLAGLYVGFIGRILLKDFRDLRGDALFGKRTFLVRHGRAATCRLSAACWVVGSATVLAVRGADAVLAVAYGAFVVAALAILRRLAVDRGPHRDERLISAIAILGRGMIVTVIGHLSMTDAGWALVARAAGLGAFTLLAVGVALDVALYGHRTRTTVPSDWTTVVPAGGGAGAA